MHIILLRGLAREAAHWKDFPTQLHAAIGDECEIHCVDFPGCGPYFRKRALRSISAMTDFARAQLTEKNICERVIVIGISMGGMVALDWAQRFPAQLGGLVIINSSAGDQPISWRLQPRAWVPLLTALIMPIPLREKLVLRYVSNDRGSFKANLRGWLQIQQQRPVSRRTIITMLNAAAGFHPLEQSIKNGLVINSAGDQLVAPAASEDLARRFAWPLFTHPSAGHDIPMDDPTWLSKTIAAWLESPNP